MKSKLLPNVWIFFVLILMIACSNNTSQKANESKNVVVKSYPSGKIVDKVVCNQNPAYNYSLYLPSYFNPAKLYPVIVAFDAHARGKMAVKRFIEASEKFGYIIIGSNSAKNGLKEIDNVVSTLFVDVFALPGIDKNRIYTAGFSGGAKVASSTAIYKGGIKGVISCAGGMPSVGQELRSKFNFISIVGLNDFNYNELKTLDKALTDNSFTNQMLTFEGAHEWPKPEVLTKAVEWMELVAIKNKEIPNNDNLIRNYITAYSDTVNKCVLANQPYQAYLLHKTYMNILDGLCDISIFIKSYDEVRDKPEVVKALKADDAGKIKEMSDQESILNMFKNSNFAGIRKEIDGLKKNTSSKDQLTVHLSKRLLSFIGMVCYMYTENALNTQNKIDFASLINIYTQVEPKNPDKEFYKACQTMMDGAPQKALEFLLQAVGYGYYDVERLQQSPYFEQLRTMPEFDVVVKKASENFDKQE